MSNLCLCGSDCHYNSCCGPFIDGALVPEVPEQLMRSRYVAYATNNIDYIIKTMYGKPLKGFDKYETVKHNQSIKWQKLEVVASSAIGNKGFVEFKAYYLYDGIVQIIHEISMFKRKTGRWFYVDGQILA